MNTIDPTVCPRFMRFFACAALGMALAAAGHAADPEGDDSGAMHDIRVDVTREGEAFRAEVSFFVPVTPQEAYEVMSDFNQMTKFMPNIESSRMIEDPGHPVIVSQKGVAKVGPFSFPFESVRAVRLQPAESIHAKMLKGNMKRFESMARFAGEKDGTRVTYRVEGVPDFWMPPVLGPAVLRGELERQFRAIAAEMLRRKQLAAAAKAEGGNALGSATR